MAACAMVPLAVVANGPENTGKPDRLKAGMMTYQADATIFEDCKLGESIGIAQEGDHLALERAYLADRSTPGAPLYVVIDGEVATRPAMEGPDRDMLIVDRFIRTRPAVTCERQRADAELVNTYWRLDILEGEAVPRETGRREAHLLLETGEDGMYRATVGCNTIRGTYAITDGALSFGGGAMTMMACPPPLDKLERQFNATLAVVSDFSIEGETLVLRDQDGEPKAVFTAVYF